MSATRGRLLLGIGVAAAIGAIVAGVMVAGTPAKTRMQRLDVIRARQLQAIANSIDQYWRREEHLPASLFELRDNPQTQVNIEDPVTANPYQYRVIDERSYELCAVFDLVSPERKPDRYGPWWHEAGRHCYTLYAPVR